MIPALIIILLVLAIAWGLRPSKAGPNIFDAYQFRGTINSSAPIKDKEMPQ